MDNLINDNIYIGSEGMGIWGKKIINYLLKLAFPNKNIIWENNNKTHIIVKSNFANHEKNWNAVKKPYIYWSGEVYNPSISPYESKSIHIETITTNINNLNTYYIPFCNSIIKYNEPLIKKYKFDTNRLLCAYCCSNPVKLREQFIDLLANKYNDIGVYALGKCAGTSKKIIHKPISGSYTDDALIKEYSNYAFVICMENQNVDGYITEKIINGFKSGAIPIFWGDSKKAKEFFNEKAFICINDYSTIDECVNYIINLFNDKEKLIKMASEPVYKDNIIPDILQIDNCDNPPEIYKNIAQNIYNMYINTDYQNLNTINRLITKTTNRITNLTTNRITSRTNNILTSFELLNMKINKNKLIK
jgi:hypothetical protein